MEARRGAVRVERPRCPYCRGELDADAEKTGCQTCLAWHHAECWSEHGACSACGGGRAARPTSPAAGDVTGEPEMQREVRRPIDEAPPLPRGVPATAGAFCAIEACSRRGAVPRLLGLRRGLVCRVHALRRLSVGGVLLLGLPLSLLLVVLLMDSVATLLSAADVALIAVVAAAFASVVGAGWWLERRAASEEALEDELRVWRRGPGG